MKKILPIVLAISMLLSIAIPTFAGNAKVTNMYDEVGNLDFNNAQFHCNDILGENGRVWTQYGKQNGNNKDKLALPSISFTRNVIDGKVWDLATEGIVCENCGRTDWITFSNKDGVPDGKNIQMQHNGPSRKWITVTVIYNVYIPACEFTCVNADAKCKFAGCTCSSICVWANDYPDHDCNLECGKDHLCLFDDPDLDLTCSTICNCAKDYSETIINEQPILIDINTGYLYEYDEAPDTWEGGALVSGSPISELLFNSKTFNVYYVGAGNCKCECDEITCDAACKLCTFKPPVQPHVHILVCSECYSNDDHDGDLLGDQDENGHKNCEGSESSPLHCLYTNCNYSIKGYEIGQCECPFCYN